CNARVAPLERSRGLRARAPTVARTQRHAHDRADRVDAAAAGVRRAALRLVGQAPPRRPALAGDHPELLSGRVRNPPATPVLFVLAQKAFVESVTLTGVKG